MANECMSLCSAFYTASNMTEATVSSSSRQLCGIIISSILKTKTAPNITNSALNITNLSKVTSVVRGRVQS